MQQRVPKYEIGIIWLDESAKDRPFLREEMVLAATRAGRIGKDKLRPEVVAYSQLGPQARGLNRRFERRSWYNASWDLREGAYTHGGVTSSCPIEGVLPESIRAGAPSVDAGEELRLAPRPWPKR